MGQEAPNNCAAHSAVERFLSRLEEKLDRLIEAERDRHSICAVSRDRVSGLGKDLQKLADGNSETHGRIFQTVEDQNKRITRLERFGYTVLGIVLFFNVVILPLVLVWFDHYLDQLAAAAGAK